MNDPLEIPAALRIPQDERRLAWIGLPLTSPAPVAPVRTMAFDSSSARVRQEVEAAGAERRRQRLAQKADAEALRRRGIKNRKLTALAIAGKITLPPPPVKIVKVVDLTPRAAAPATQETDVKKRKLPNTHPAVRGAKSRTAGREPTGTRAKRDAGAKVDIVAKIAAMMARKNGASMAEMVEATGIEAHPMRAKIKLVRDRLGYTTEAPSKANGYRYHAKVPAAAPKGLDGDEPAKFQ